eukprot:scaffold20449_cov67-Phaeocystis_antarctica.AAC.4
MAPVDRLVTRLASGSFFHSNQVVGDAASNELAYHARGIYDKDPHAARGSSRCTVEQREGLWRKLSLGALLALGVVNRAPCQGAAREGCSQQANDMLHCKSVLLYQAFTNQERCFVRGREPPRRNVPECRVDHDKRRVTAVGMLLREVSKVVLHLSTGGVVDPRRKWIGKTPIGRTSYAVVRKIADGQPAAAAFEQPTAMVVMRVLLDGRTLPIRRRLGDLRRKKVRL